MRPGLESQAATASQEMHWLKEGSSHFGKAALPTPPPLSSFDLETVSNPRDSFFKEALMTQVLGFWGSQPDEKLLSQDQQSTKFKCKLLNFFLGRNQ